ncbi:peptidyl-alpha-hydroxyglycine alpha-amidating lyase 1-like isoform X1 [Lutzomyia longipalpis]|uniref:peptidyl-alpha-hydroxyglycine alpha-amidating lyase 1-like isoform X1 n=1 Tax=Lutzomyia longipalpis TaxID=7200 RepID=UPI002483CEA6|nr:peptidyl-alpha-hydroxyglycine alpha-amidating lyase 1-like isoform X1 [Lutzomyia longipalpis]
MENSAKKVLLIATLYLFISFQTRTTEAFDTDDYALESRQFLQKAIEEVGRTQNNPQNAAGVKEQLLAVNSTYTYDDSWPSPGKMNSISAVSLDREGNVVIFHRAGRVWGQLTFDMKNQFTQTQLGAIQESTILAFSRKTGILRYSLGRNLFYMPHGLTVDDDSNIWVTDVALHQVMKLRKDQDKPLMVLGRRFKPGNGADTFCKPTSVAVLPSGDFFVADGYCNARIIKFSAAGKRILTWGENSFQGVAHKIAPPNFLAIPHALTLARDKGLVCVADRENGRVQCFHATNGTFHSQYHSPLVGDRIYGVSYAPIDGGHLYVINGPLLAFALWPGQENSETYHEVRGFVFDMTTQAVVDKFGLPNKDFSNPHDVVVSADGAEVYVAEIGELRPRKFISSIKRKVDGAYEGVGGNSTGGVAPKAATSVVDSGATALLAVILIVVFAIAAFGATLLVMRQRKRGHSSTLSVLLTIAKECGSSSNKCARDGMSLSGLKRLYKKKEKKKKRVGLCL